MSFNLISDYPHAESIHQVFVFRLVHVTPSPSLAHHVLAVSLCESPSDDVVGTNVAGFICVTEVHLDKASMTVLCPQPLPLPRSILILSEITFMDMN